MIPGIENPFSLIQKRLNKMRVNASLQGMGIIQCYNGTTGYGINPFTGTTEPTDLLETEMKDFKKHYLVDNILYIF